MEIKHKKYDNLSKWEGNNDEWECQACYTIINFSEESYIVNGTIKIERDKNDILDWDDPCFKCKEILGNICDE